MTLCGTSRTRVFGTDVLLVGTKHDETGNSFDPCESELYERLIQFEPQILFVEQVGWDEDGERMERTLDQYQSTRDQKDHATLLAYAQDTDTPIRLYEQAGKITGDEAAERVGWIFMAEYSRVTDALDRRRMLREQNPSVFRGMMTEREEYATFRFMDALGETERVAIHCGDTHRKPYANTVQFLSHRTTNANGSCSP